MHCIDSIFYTYDCMHVRVQACVKPQGGYTVNIHVVLVLLISPLFWNHDLHTRTLTLIQLGLIVIKLKYLGCCNFISHQCHWLSQELFCTIFYKIF